MIWDNKISIESFLEDVQKHQENCFLGDMPVNAQFALDLIFKTLVDDKEDYPYLTTIPESTEQVNCIMLFMILNKYSRKFRKALKKRRAHK